MSIRSIAHPERLIDALTLVLIIALSAIPYVGRLNFTSDGWGIIGHFQAAERAGRSIIAATLPNFGVRPVQGLYLAMLYEGFGLDPIGYHLVNTMVIAASVVLLYLLLLRLRFSRTEAFASALIFALLPQLSTVRVWYAAFQIPLSMLFMLVSMHAQLSARRSSPIAWSIIAGLAAALSIAAYEIFILLVAGFAVALLFTDRLERRQHRWAAPAVVLVATLCGALLKLFSARAAETVDVHHYIGVAYGLVWPGYDWRINSGLNLFAGARFYLWLPLRHGAQSIVALVTGGAGPLITAMVLLIVLLSWWRLHAPDDREAQSKRTLIVGLTAFLLAHATFIFIGAIVFAPAGTGNRTLVGGAIGAAIILVALFGLASRRLWPRRSTALFTALVLVTSVAASARTELIDRYWAEAPQFSQPILQAAKVDLRGVPTGSRVILDGVCPYHGPAIVFETYWGVGGALSIVLGREMHGGAVSPRMSIVPTGLKTSIYDEQRFYPFGKSLFIYNPRLRVVAALPDLAAARAYFSRPGRWPPCPVGYAGHGALI